jgi:large subunit ribosomal protein L32
MTAHPKIKISPTRKRMKNSHSALKPPKLQPCPQCGEMRPPHRVCINCGTYKGQQVLKLKEKKKK